jgi:hypothetical protein
LKDVPQEAFLMYVYMNRRAKMNVKTKMYLRRRGMSKNGRIQTSTQGHGTIGLTDLHGAACYCDGG